LIGGVAAINNRPDMRGWKLPNQFKIRPKGFQPKSSPNIMTGIFMTKRAEKL